MNLVGIDVEHDSDSTMATDCVRVLVDHYPGHDWHVMIRGGVIHVKAMNIHPNWGMCLHYTQVKSDAQDRKRSLVRAAGEFLERANLRRGKREEGKTLHVEGVPDKQMARASL